MILLASFCEGSQVLWDMSHGIHIPFLHPDTIHPRFQEIIEEEGLTLVLSDTGILNLNLSEYEGMILAITTSALSNYSPDEIGAIQDFVIQGGGLLIMSDNLGAPGVYNLNSIAQAFGTTLIVIGDYIGQPYSFFSFSEHPIFEGVSEIVFALGNGLAPEPPSVVAAWDSTDWRHLIAVTLAEVGEGKFVATGDENVFTDMPPSFDPNRCCIFEADNEVFARNVIRWLFGGGVLNAGIDIKPDVLNRKSQGRWITAYIELPGSRDPSDIEVSKTYITFQDDTVTAELSPTEVGDYDGDGISDRMVKFDREAVIEMLDEVDVPEVVTLTVSGELTGGIPFSGEDIIRIIEPGKKKPSAIESDIQISPNPFASNTNIRFILTTANHQLPVTSNVSLKIYDITGRLVRSLVDFASPITNYQSPITITWDSRDDKGIEVSPGIYFSRLKTGNFSQSRKIVVLR